MIQRDCCDTLAGYDGALPMKTLSFTSLNLRFLIFFNMMLVHY